MKGLDIFVVEIEKQMDKEDNQFRHAIFSASIGD